MISAAIVWGGYPPVGTLRLAFLHRLDTIETMFIPALVHTPMAARLLVFLSVSLSLLYPSFSLQVATSVQFHLQFEITFGFIEMCWTSPPY